jgi:hypothetical protein
MQLCLMLASSRMARPRDFAQMSITSVLIFRLGLGLALLVMPGVAAWPDAALAQSPGMSEKEAFEAAKSLGTVEAWDAFLSNYPNGFHADLARAMSGS